MIDLQDIRDDIRQEQDEQRHQDAHQADHQDQVDGLDQDQAEGQRIAAALAAMTPPDAQAPGETLAAYRCRLLRWVLNGGSPGRLDHQERRQLDIAAQAATVALPCQLEAHQARIDRQLSDLRHRIARIDQARAQAGAQLAAWLDQAPQDPEPDIDAQAADQADQDPQARALRLLRAALTLVMQPPSDGDQRPPGGSKVPRPTPPPTQPPSGSTALPVPVAAGDRPRIQF